MITRFDGSYRFLSNFWPTEVVYEGETYPSVENAYQAAKTLNKDVRQVFKGISAPQAKREGGKLSLRPDWDSVKLGIMQDLVRDKFNGDFQLKALLLSTKDQYLEEGNWWGDGFWGVCRGVGENHLGKILMQVRSELKIE